MGWMVSDASDNSFSAIGTELAYFQRMENRRHTEYKRHKKAQF